MFVCMICMFFWKICVRPEYMIAIMYRTPSVFIQKKSNSWFLNKKKKVFHKYVLILVLSGRLKTFWHSDICYRQRFSVIIYIFVHFESFNLKYSENSQRITQESEVEVFSKWRWRRFIRWRDGKEVVVISVFLQKSCS